jgi:hypothetical protein
MRGDKRKRGLEFSAEAEGREPSGTYLAAWACHPRARFFCGTRPIRPITAGRKSSPNGILPGGADLPMIPWEGCGAVAVIFLTALALTLTEQGGRAKKGHFMSSLGAANTGRPRRGEATCQNRQVQNWPMRFARLRVSTSPSAISAASVRRAARWRGGWTLCRARSCASCRSATARRPSAC